MLPVPFVCIKDQWKKYYNKIGKCGKSHKLQRILNNEWGRRKQYDRSYED